MTKEDILEDIKTMKQAKVAKKYGVSPGYISIVKKQDEEQKELTRLRTLVQEQLRLITNLNHEIKFFTDLIHRKPILAYPDKMSEVEKIKWEAL